MIENDRRKYHQGSREIFENCFSINSSSKVLSYFDVEPSNGNYQRNYRRVLYRRLPSTNTIGPHPRRTAFTCRTNTSTKFARREPICRRYFEQNTNSLKSEQTRANRPFQDQNSRQLHCPFRIILKNFINSFLKFVLQEFLFCNKIGGKRYVNIGQPFEEQGSSLDLSILKRCILKRYRIQ